MPALTKATEALRITQAVRALSLMSQGKTQGEACQEAGITPWQLRNWLGKEAEALNTIRDMTIELERSNLASVIAARARIIERLYEIVTTTPLPAKDLVVVDQHLADVQETLENKYGTQAQDAEAEEFLKLSGPALKTEDSVFAARLTQTTTTTTVEITRKEEEGEIIDGEFKEEKE